MRVTLIVAMARNRVIGQDNRLPWHLRGDLRRFKELTWGHCLLMGRKTCDSIGCALPGRTTIVLSRDASYEPPSGVLTAPSLEAALALAEKTAQGEELFVAGGAEIYRETLPRAERIQRTLIERDFPGDAFFPEIDPAEWTVAEDRAAEPTSADEPPYRFQVLERRPATVAR
jgi:dihydrofolate reductase